MRSIICVAILLAAMMCLVAASADSKESKRGGILHRYRREKPVEETTPLPPQMNETQFNMTQESEFNMTAQWMEQMGQADTMNMTTTTLSPDQEAQDPQAI